MNFELTFTKLSRGFAWLDTGNPAAMHDAAVFVKVIEDRTGLKIACLEEIAYRNHWITRDHMISLINGYRGNSYGNYLMKFLESEVVI